MELHVCEAGPEFHAASGGAFLGQWLWRDAVAVVPASRSPGDDARIVTWRLGKQRLSTVVLKADVTLRRGSLSDPGPA